jgi:hypothetical protein
MHIPNADDMIRWIHFLCVAVAAGGMLMCLLVSGFEDTKEDIRGLSAVLWSRVVGWSLRLGLVTGLGMIGWMHKLGRSPFGDYWIWVKLGLVVVLFGLSESTPKALAVGKRGGALLAMLLLLLATFTAFNRSVFGSRPAATAPAVMAPAK